MAILAQKLVSKNAYPNSIETYMACRIIPLKTILASGLLELPMYLGELLEMLLVEFEGRFPRGYWSTAAELQDGAIQGSYARH